LPRGDFESDAQEKQESLRGFTNFETLLPSPRTTTGKDVGSFLSRLAIVATQLFRMMLPVSARHQFQAIGFREDQQRAPEREPR
jgi:hypothetical protein